MILNEEQEAVFRLVESTNDNILLLGKPGVGKSVLINYLVEHGNKNYTVAAPTGLAAINIRTGRTLHSMFSIPTYRGVITFNPQTVISPFIRYHLKHLIIDEVSMVRADVLDYVDEYLRTAKGIDRPFGGVQVILVGDFFQLPPVCNSSELKSLLTAYDSEYAFSARCFKDFKVVSLNKAMRQNDADLLEVLDAIRENRVAHSHLKLLNSRVSTNPGAIYLTPMNAEADSENMKNLAALKGDMRIFRAAIKGSWPALPVEEELKLKVGAKVIVKQNHADVPIGQKPPEVPNVVNGFISYVSELGANTVTLLDGTVIHRKRFEYKIKDHDDKIKTVASMEQIPLSLCWAMSIHKSQGQTFDRCHINIHRIFAPGQVYVALSRVKTLEGLTLENKVYLKKFFNSKKITEFYEKLK